MRTPVKWLLVLVAAASLAAAVEWVALNRAREEKQAMTARLKAMEQALEQQGAQGNTQRVVTSEPEDTEILRLRNEVASLRGLKLEVERLRGENARLRALLDSEKASARAELLSWVAAARTNWVQPGDVPYLLQALTNEQTRVRLEATWALRNI